jgi:Sulfotransferase domain.
LLHSFFTKDGVVNIDVGKFISNFESTRNLNFIKSKSQSDFRNLDKLEILSKYFLQAQSKTNLYLKEDFGFFKTHSANIKIFNNPFTLIENLRGYIYIVRDPRDVLISWSKYANISLEDSIDFIINENSCINWIQNEESLLNPKIIPKVAVSSWGNHLKSWVNNYNEIPKLILRYEDIISQKETTLIKIIKFFKDNYDISFINVDKKIINIIETSKFENLRNQEKRTIHR